MFFCGFTILYILSNANLADNMTDGFLNIINQEISYHFA